MTTPSPKDKTDQAKQPPRPVKQKPSPTDEEIEQPSTVATAAMAQQAKEEETKSANRASYRHALECAGPSSAVLGDPCSLACVPCCAIEALGDSDTTERGRGGWQKAQRQYLYDHGPNRHA